MGWTDWFSPANQLATGVKVATNVAKVMGKQTKVAPDAHAASWKSGAGYNVSNSANSARLNKDAASWQGTPKPSAFPAFDPSSILKQSAWMTPSQIALANAGAQPTPTPRGGGDGGAPAGPSAYELQSQKDRARLAALYDAYSKQVSGAQGNINTNYDASRAAMGDIYSQAASQTNLGYDAARAALTAQMQALGLSGIMPPTNTTAQLAAADRYTNLGTIAQTQSEAERQAALANNQALVNAIAGENRGALENFDRTVAENVARQQQAQAEAAASAQAAANAAAARQAETDWQHQFKYDQLAAGAKTQPDVNTILQQVMANGGAGLTPEQAALANFLARG